MKIDDLVGVVMLLMGSGMAFLMWLLAVFLAYQMYLGVTQ